MKKLFILLALGLTACDFATQSRSEGLSDRVKLIKLRSIPDTGCDLYYADTGLRDSGAVVVCPTQPTPTCTTDLKPTDGPGFGEFNLKLDPSISAIK